VRPRRTERFPTPWPADGPDSADFHAALQPGGSPAVRVPVRAIRPVPLPAGLDAAAAVEQLRREGWRARPDLPPLPLTLPIDWAADPHRDDNWRVQLNMLRLLDPLIHAHEARVDDRALPQALELGIAWHTFHHDPRRLHDFAWLDMSTGLRALRAAYLAEQIRTGRLRADPARQAALAAMLERHWQELVSPGFLRYTNHTIWDLHALEALVRITLPDADPRRAAWRQAIGLRIDHLVERQFGPDGLHLENSPQYHFVASGMLRVLHATGWYKDTAPALATSLAGAAGMDAWMRLPDGRPIPIGDSDGSAPGATALPRARPPGGDDRIESLDSGGYTIVRRTVAGQADRWSLLAVKAGIAPGGHLHHDLLSWLWSESGCDIVIDPGKYAYDHGPLRDYFKGNRAHNLIVFDARECDTEATPACRHTVGELQAQPWGRTAVARVRHRPVDVDHERRYHVAPGRWVVIVDRFEAAGPVAFEHLTHLAPEFSAAWHDRAYALRHRDGSTLHSALHVSVPFEARVCTGVDGPAPQGWCSRGYRRAEPCPTLSVQGQARAACIVLALSLEPGVRLAPGADGGLHWTAGDADLALATGPLHATIAG
jgi:hypothetical protein